MLPLLTFASGLVAGIVGLRLLKNAKAPEGLKAATGTIGDKARHGLDQAQTGLREATVSGLAAIEKSSASLRAKLTPEAVKTKPAIRKVKVKSAVPEASTKPAAKRRPKAELKAKPAAPETEGAA